MRELLLALRVDAWVLPALVAWPLAGALLVRALGRAGAGTGHPAWRDPRLIALAALGVECALAAALWGLFDPGLTGWQAVVDRPLVTRWGARVALGVDGMSLVMLMLATLLPALGVLGARGDGAHPRRDHALLLVLVAGSVGALVALDLLLFWLFWALALAATSLATGRGRWHLAVVGGTSLLLLVAIVLLWLAAGSRTFGLDALLAATRGALSTAGQLYLFAAFLAAFAAQSALFPLHAWLPAAQRHAPPSVAAALGVKLGAYAVLRFALPFFPAAAAHPTLRLVVVSTAVAGMLYGALLAAAQPEPRRLLSLAAVSQLSLVALGVFALDVPGVQGALMAVVGHALAFGALFLLVGMLERRGLGATVASLRGVRRAAPWAASLLALAALGAVGVPGTVGAVAAALVLQAAWRSYPVAAVLAGIALLGAALWLVRALRSLLAGAPADPGAAPRDLGRAERVAVGALALAIVLLGVFPGIVLRRTEGAAQRIVEQVSRGAVAAPVEPVGRRGGGGH